MSISFTIELFYKILSIYTFELSGDAYSSLQYLFRLPPCTIGRIVPTVCQVIYDNNLKEEYLKVCIKISNEQIQNKKSTIVKTKIL